MRYEAVCERCGKPVERVRSGVWHAEKSNPILFHAEAQPPESKQD
ncbi:MAG: hypothetical protein RIS85_2430 [Pseudomonadota bacterium]|jgi:ribosomal protein L37AE/L43A